MGVKVSYVPVDPYGMVAPEDVEEAVTGATCLVSIMHGNNEVGAVNPIREIARRVRRGRVVVHSDAVQTFGKIPISVGDLEVDMLSASAHKIYGPKGIGILYIRKGVAVDRWMHGGAQERGRRAGTENVPLAVGFAKAVALSAGRMSSESRRLELVKQRMREILLRKFPFLLVNGPAESGLPNILNVSFDSTKIALDSEALLFNLDLAGIAVTSGSACTSGSVDPSHVLLAMGRDPATAKTSLRFSFGTSTTDGDIDYTIAELERIVGRIGTHPSVA
jgi:cysteine desulfurase